MNWMSKHSTEHRANLLNEMPIDNHASEGPHKNGKKLKNKINKLSDKHKGLYDSVIEGYGQNEYTSGNYDKDYKKLGKVEDRLKRKEKRYEEKFNKSPYAPNMEGPLNEGLISMKNKKPRIEVEVTKTPKKKYLQLTKTKRLLTPKEVKDLRPNMEGPLDKCAKSEGGNGCIKKVGGSCRVESNKTGKLWPAKYKSESSAKAGLRGYHAG